MLITATELKTNVGRYLALADDEDIVITKNGRHMAKLVSARDAKISELHALRGIIKGSGATKESIREERRSKYDASAH